MSDAGTRRGSKKVIAVGALVAVAIGTGIGLSVFTSGQQNATAPAGIDDPVLGDERIADADGVRAFAADYLDEWVDDGRVVRRDEGDDTVSEGQAYGLFAAIFADDESAFDEVWDWTVAELQRPDGLLAWQWADGAVTDAESATDADLDAARALIVAARQFDRPDLEADGVALATAILDELTAVTEVGRILLPGQWASDDPFGYNPSYSSPAAFSLLAEATQDDRWDEVAAGSAAVTGSLLAAVDLPSDWAQVHSDGRVEVMPGANGGGDEVTYGFDAARMPLRYAESCVSTDVELSAQTYQPLARFDDIAARLDLGGTPLSDERSPLAFAARAAAAASAGDASAARLDLARAVQVADEFPTYYGASWALIGAGMLLTDDLGGCPPLRDDTSSAAEDAGSAGTGIRGTAAADGSAVAAGALQDPRRATTETTAMAPVRVEIPRIGVDASIESLGLEPDGELAAPVEFDDAGWYANGVTPGRVGPAILAGHVDSRYGPAVFFRLHELSEGDEVIVTMDDGSRETFAVTRSEQSDKASFPTSDVYHNVPRPELRLITCAGTFDTTACDYSDNLVVFAALR